jgi:hypothetical protein
LSLVVTLYVPQTLAGRLAGVFAICLAAGQHPIVGDRRSAVSLGFITVYNNPARQFSIHEMVR